MKKLLLKLLFAVMLFSFASCSNPLDRVYNENTLSEDLEIIVARDKAYKADMENLAYYLTFMQISGDSLEGKTYRELIKSANEFVLEEVKEKSRLLEKPFNEKTMHEDFAEIVEKGAISGNEMENLSVYFAHAQVTGISFEGKTYGEIIEEANAFSR
jgi:hypothetical protein